MHGKIFTGEEVHPLYGAPLTSTNSLPQRNLLLHIKNGGDGTTGTMTAGTQLQYSLHKNYMQRLYERVLDSDAYAGRVTHLLRKLAPSELQNRKGGLIGGSSAGITRQGNWTPTGTFDQTYNASIPMPTMRLSSGQENDLPGGYYE